MKIHKKMTNQLSKQFKKEITVYELHPPIFSNAYIDYEEIRPQMLNPNSIYHELYKFPVFKGQIYTFENSTVVPVEKSSKYRIVEGFFERIFEILKNKTDGSWCVSERIDEPIMTPLSMIEREEIANYDKSALRDIPFGTPKNLVYPNIS